MSKGLFMEERGVTAERTWSMLPKLKEQQQEEDKEKEEKKKYREKKMK